MIASQLLLSFLLLLLLPTLSPAWTCYPPQHLLPLRQDCVALILGLHHLSTLPADEADKRWSRHLPTTSRTEQLPKWYYIVDEQRPPNTCTILVDAATDRDDAAVGNFGLRDVVSAGKAVYEACLVNKGQVGLEFPSEDAYIVAKMLRLDRSPPGIMEGPMDGKALGGWRNRGRGREREVRLPDGRGVLHIADVVPGRRRNVSEF
ncbi:MAG: hypothetical protein Q9185_004663 [Variospora sp. 1 TL-2023]